MRVAMIMPGWSLTMPWVPIMRSALEKAGHEVTISNAAGDSEVRVFTWMDRETVQMVNDSPPGVQNICFMRRYEYFSGYWMQADFSKISHIFCVNDFFGAHVLRYVKDRCGVSVLYNPVDFSRWKFRERSHGKKVAMVGYVNRRKGFQLALQIIDALPRDYELHVLGDVQCRETLAYIDCFSMRRKFRVTITEPLENDQVDLWLEDKDYLLCCADSEGNPNNVIEAMAKGIKPVVHAWPGAYEQFGGNVFFSVDEGAYQILEGEYDSKLYRMLAEAKFNAANYRDLLDKIGGPVSAEAGTKL